MRTSGRISSAGRP